MPARPHPDARARRPRSLAVGHPAYPAGLRDLSDAPPEVFVLGSDPPPVEEAVAIVGSRAASLYGLEQAGRLAGDLSRLGFVVVSGLARGIDAAAHRGALEAGGRTVAVIPSGLDTITPRHHEALAGEIAARGTVLSEWARGSPFGPGGFVKRNRLIAALAGATVVVEAAEKSGALITAAFASGLSRPVLAVPGDVDRETARGCHALIRRGARLCGCAGHVIEALAEPRGRPAREARAEGRGQGASGAGRDPGRNAGALAAPQRPGSSDRSTREARVLAVLDHIPRTVDALALASGLTVPEILSALLVLQWVGAAAARPGQRWTREGR